jgi:pimeloyl-ACP methyl ester carboxylesterase
MKRLIIRTLAEAAILTTTAAVLATPAQDGKGKYAEVNGLKMYCEIHGTGRPLVLLHGAFGWATVYPILAKNRQVIAIELQGHGHW